MISSSPLPRPSLTLSETKSTFLREDGLKNGDCSESLYSQIESSHGLNGLSDPLANPF
jgi:hypothetical protein